MTPKSTHSLLQVVRASSLHSIRYRLSEMDDLQLPRDLVAALGDELVDLFEDRFPEYLKMASRRGDHDPGGNLGSLVRKHRPGGFER